VADALRAGEGNHISWQEFIALPYLGEYLSLADIALALIGFGITVTAAVQAKAAALRAQEAAEQARARLLKFDLITEIVTILQLLEELKRLNRGRSIELLPEKYSLVRSKMVAIRESGQLLDEADKEMLQDSIVRISFLERLHDRNADSALSNKQFAKANESLTVCTDSMISMRERARLRSK
jgi:heme exporter protein D